MVNTPEVLAIIPARGGSKGIPRKNIRSFAGHPLLAWSIAAGKHSRLVHRVIVSTDDEEIAEVARAYGAETPFLRPAEFAQDSTVDLPVFQHALQWLAENEGYRPSTIVQLRPTSPLRPPGLIDKAVITLLSDDWADSVRSVTTPSQNPFKMWTIREGILQPLLMSDLSEPYNAPRQSLPPTYWQTGHVDVFRSSTIERTHSLTGARILPVTIDARYAVDIDEMFQWRLAEELLSVGELDVVEPDGLGVQLLAGIRLLVFDFDGVFTDNRVYVNQDGVESVCCSRSDGLGIDRLRSHGIEAAVLSTEVNPVVTARCSKLQLPVMQGLANKGQALRDLADARGVTLAEVAYVGNDLNDIECMNIARIAIVPADAHPSVRGLANAVLRNRGGDGAVREVCELAIRARLSEREELCTLSESATV